MGGFSGFGGGYANPVQQMPTNLQNYIGGTGSQGQMDNFGGQQGGFNPTQFGYNPRMGGMGGAMGGMMGGGYSAWPGQGYGGFPGRFGGGFMPGYNYGSPYGFGGSMFGYGGGNPYGYGPGSYSPWSAGSMGYGGGSGMFGGPQSWMGGWQAPMMPQMFGGGGQMVDYNQQAADLSGNAVDLPRTGGVKPPKYRPVRGTAMNRPPPQPKTHPILRHFMMMNDQDNKR